MPKYAVVIPAFNEAKTVREVTEQVLKNSIDLVIVVDDGSTDGTADTVRDLPIMLIEHEQNQGKAVALVNGMKHAADHGVDAIITLDADGQHKPEDIPRFIKTYEENSNHIIIGARLADKHLIPRKRYIANKIANFWISWAAGYPIEDSQSGFRLYPAELIRSIDIKVSKDKSFVFESEILIKAAQLNYYSTPIKIAAIYEEDSRPSHFRGGMDITYITRMVAWSLITRFFYLPGLYRSAIKPQLVKLGLRTGMGLDGIAMMILSCFVIVLTGGVFYFWLLFKTWMTARYTAIPEQTFNTALVLGMALDNNQPRPFYLARLERAKNILLRNTNMKIMILGGKTGQSALTEAEAGRDYLLSQDVPESNIVLEDVSRHTLENLKQAKNILSEQELQDTALISQRYHLYRAHTLANGFKIPHTLCPADDIFRLNFLNSIRLLKEAFYTHWYWTGKIFSILINNQYMLNRIR